MKKLARIALVTALALTLAAVLAVSACAEANEEYIIVIKVVDVEDETSVLATDELTLWNYGDTYSIYPWSYCPANCNPVNQDMITVTAGVDEEVVIVAAPLKTFSIPYRLINIDDTREIIRAGTAKLAGHYGDTVANYNVYGALPMDWSLYWVISERLTLGVDTSRTFYLRKYESFPITIQYYDIESTTGEPLLSQSVLNVKGIRGSTYAVQPEDGLIPYGYALVDSCEFNLKLGLDSVAEFLVQKQHTYNIQVIWMDARDDSHIVRVDSVPISGLPGWEMRYDAYNEDKYPNNPPYGWRIVKQDYPIITLGSTVNCVLMVDKPEYYNVNIKFIDNNTNETVATNAVCLYGMRGDRSYIEVFDMLPEGYSIYRSPNTPVLGTDTELTAYVIPTYINPSINQTYEVTARLWDVDTMESLGTQTLSVRGAKGGVVFGHQLAISNPEGYCVLSNNDHVILGTKNETNVYFYSLASQTHTVTLRGVSSHDPSIVVDERQVDIDYYNMDYSWLYYQIHPPEGYVLDYNAYLPTFHDSGNDLPIVYTYYLTPIERYEATLRFINADDPDELVEERAVSYYNGNTDPALLDNAYCCNVIPPEGWRLKYNDSSSYTQYYSDNAWLSLYPWQTEPITIPVIKDGGYTVTLKLANALRPKEVVSSKAVTVDYPKGYMLRFSSNSLACPDGWKYASTSQNTTIRVGYDDSVTLYAVPIISSRPALLPDDLTSIAEGAFAGTSLISVILPDGLKSIGAGAFSGCVGLKYVSIPESVTDIGEGAFADCPNLVIICTAGSDAESYAKDSGLYSYTGDKMPVYAP